MPQELPFIPGSAPDGSRPLARFLPRLERGTVSAWLEENVPPGEWVLDPFGAAPELAAEAARAGYRVLVAANNPIARFLIESNAMPPSEDDLHAALADLASARRGDERLEPHILSLYTTRCDNCGGEVHVQAFLWERDAHTPHARIYVCPHCEQRGEYRTTEEDRQKARRYASGGLHRARALERIASVDDPDRAHAEEALDAYLPRSVYALFTLINKLDGLRIPSERKKWVWALLISACDQGNVLWPHPAGRPRPRQLSVPPQFRENNIWFALEEAVEAWTRPESAAALTYWPDPPPEEGGISLYEGRLRGLADSLPEEEIRAVVTAFPRPNQAFWTLSALWAGWLWGKEALGPFVSALRRRRYDWAWHTSALQAALSHLAEHLPAETPMFGLVTESEAGFDGAAMIAAELASFRLENYALRPEAGQTQLLWRRGEKKSPGKPPTDIGELLRQAPAQVLRRRGEPSHYLHLQAAVLRALAENNALPDGKRNPGEVFYETRDQIEFALTFRSSFVRFGGAESSLEIGQWWLEADGGMETPLSDQVEMALVQHLLETPGIQYTEMEKHLCTAFPGVVTPGAELIYSALSSYGREQEEDGWGIREADQPQARREDLKEMQAHLQELGERLGYQVEEGKPMRWLTDEGDSAYEFHLMASAVLGEVVFGSKSDPGKSIVVLPGGRANLVLHKLERDGRLRQAVEHGWRFLKFRHVRRLVKNRSLRRETLDEQFGLDPITEDEAQIPLL